jgi:hydroxyacyl-ACP dehydratase HTD2-like protein with hotdog domain
MPTLTDMKIGDELPIREHVASNVSLFLYNAAVWNAHRIHYDETYTLDVEKHPGVIVDGPLQGDWLAQVVTNWLGDDGELIEFEYSNRRMSVIGEVLVAGGSITAIDGREVSIELFIRNADGEVTTPGQALVRF